MQREFLLPVSGVRLPTALKPLGNTQALFTVLQLILSDSFYEPAAGVLNTWLPQLVVMFGQVVGGTFRM